MKELKKKKITKIFLGATILMAAFFLGAVYSDYRQDDSISQPVKVEELAPNYFVYSEESLRKSFEKGRTVLFFWAPWCGTCSILDEDLMERSEMLPSGVTVLRINFDTEKDLKTKYQITQQHELVEIDKNLNVVYRWIGGDVDVLKKNLSRS